VSQLSLFSADLTPPRVEDLGSLLAAHGQISMGPDGTRLSILLADPWRAKALLREFRVRDVVAEIVPAAEALASGLIESLATRPEQSAGQDEPEDGYSPVDPLVLLRSERCPDLDALGAAWTRGAVKSVPSSLVAAAGLLRCWTLAAGRHHEAGFLLGLDRHAPDTHVPLASACASAGLAGALIGARGGGPALRIVGNRRQSRLVELLGTPPPEAPPASFPHRIH